MTSGEQHKLKTHCWHYQSGWTDGFGTSGEDAMVCCQCGGTEYWPWSMTQSPHHGRFVNCPEKVYRVVRGSLCTPVPF